MAISISFFCDTVQVKGMENKFRLMPELLRALIRLIDPKANKKINFGALVVGEDTKRGDNENEVAVETKVVIEAPVAEVKKEEVIVSVEQQKLDAAPVKKASAKKEEKKKINLDEIDKKLDEILDIGLDNV
jgi:hypothetical protein